MSPADLSAMYVLTKDNEKLAKVIIVNANASQLLILMATSKLKLVTSLLVNATC